MKKKDEEQGSSKMVNVSIVDCCATCEHWSGWLDNMQCAHHGMDVKPYWVCDGFKLFRRRALPDVVADGGSGRGSDCDEVT